ncbi:MAG: restriction endonuclease subunit S [Methanosphaera stadtmanae]|nr:restriction endonuclease subunit S [Methanosphaera stadtmanae]
MSNYKTLEEIAHIYTGLRTTRYINKNTKHKQEILKKIDTNNTIETEKQKLTEIDEKYYSKKDDILIHATGTTNTINIIKQEGIIIPAHYIILRVKQDNPEFIYHILKSEEFKKIERKLSGGTKLHFLKTPDLKKMKIKIPNPEKQKTYVKIMELINKKTQLEERKIEINKNIQKWIFKKELGENYVKL